MKNRWVVKGSSSAGGRSSSEEVSTICSTREEGEGLPDPAGVERAIWNFFRSRSSERVWSRPGEIIEIKLLENGEERYEM